MAFTQINFCPRCGTPIKLENKFGKVRAICPACRWIHFADPKVAAAVLIEQEGRVLLVRRANEPLRGLWTLPAGFLEIGFFWTSLRRDSTGFARSAAGPSLAF